MHLLNKVGDLKSELNTLNQALKRHEEICAKNVEQTNKEFGSIKKELKRSKKPFFGDKGKSRVGGRHKILERRRCLGMAKFIQARSSGTKF